MLALSLKIFVGCVTVVMLGLWGNWMFRTTAAMKQFHIQADDATGRNFLRADIGGVVLSMACLMVLFLVHSNLWAYPLAIILSCLVIGRTISLITDGPSNLGLQAMFAEVVILAVMLLSIFKTI